MTAVPVGPAAPRPPVVSIVIVSWNTRGLLVDCLRSLRRSDPTPACEVIVVDNASSDDTVEVVRRDFPEVRLIETGMNLGYAAGNNVGIEAARGRHVFLLNSDTEVRPDAIRRLSEFLDAHPEHAAASAKLLNPDGSLQRACMNFPTRLTAVAFDTWFGKRVFKREVDRYFARDFDHLHSADVLQPPAAALMIRREVLDRFGALVDDLFLFFNDVELCRRLHRLGYRVRFLAEAEIVHHGGASTKLYRDFALEWHKNRARYYRLEYGATGFLLAKAMTAWRAFEEWWRTARKMKDREERRAATRAILAVVKQVWSDPGEGDPRVAPRRVTGSRSSGPHPAA